MKNNVMWTEFSLAPFLPELKPDIAYGVPANNDTAMFWQQSTRARAQYTQSYGLIRMILQTSLGIISS